MRPLTAGKVFVGLVVLVVLHGSACFRDPDPKKMKCIPDKGCPSGYSCVVMGDAGGFCRPIGDGSASSQDLLTVAADGSGGETTDSRGETTGRDGSADRAGEQGDGRTQDSSALDAPENRTDAFASEDGAGSGSDAPVGGAAGAAGGAGGTGGTAGVSGTGGAIALDARPSDTPATGDAPVGDSAADAPLGTGGVISGGSSGSSTGGTGGAGTGGVSSASTGGTAATAGSGGASGGATDTGGTGAAGIGGSSSGGVETGGTTSSGGTVCSLGGEPAPNSMTVQVDGAVSVVNKEIFGVGLETLGKQMVQGLVVGTDSPIPNTDGMRNDMIEGLKEAGVGLIQFQAGCSSTSYLWSTNKTPKYLVGTDRFMELCNLVGAEPYIVGRPAATDAASNLAWVEYIQGTSGWALKYFKLGWEVWGCGGSMTESDYESIFSTNHSNLTGKDLFMVAAGGFSYGTNPDWDWYRTLLDNISSKINAVGLDHRLSYGTYPSVGFTPDHYYKIVNAANEGEMHPTISALIDVLNQKDPANHIKIAVEGWGDELAKIDTGFMQQNTVMDAVSAAEHLHLFIEHAHRITLASIAQTVNVMQALFLTNADEVMVKTPTFYVFKMFIPHHSNGAKSAPKALASELITTSAGTFPVLSAAATVDSTGRVNVSLVNVDLENPRTIEITLNGAKSSYAVSSASVITGPAMDSFNDYGQSEAVTIKPLDSASTSTCGNLVRVTLPPKSVVMLALE